MESSKILVSLVAIFALVFLFSGIVSADVSGAVSIESVKVNNVEVLNSGVDLSSFAGQVVPVQVTFTAHDNSSDVRIKGWISGTSGSTAVSDRFEVLADKTYTRTMNLQMPLKIDPTESMQLVITIESREGIIGGQTIDFTVQRESYIVEILDVNMDNKVVAGDSLALGIVLKNIGMRFAEDTFVKAKIPALGIEQKAYFGDLSPVDQADPDKEDAVERKMLLKVPSNAKPGIYTVEIEAYNADSSTSLSKKIAIVGASEDSMAVSPAKSKTFAAGGNAEYSLTLVNSGSKVKIYEVSVDAPAGLIVVADKTIVAIPAGQSDTVNFQVSAAKEGSYDFVVTVQSGGDTVSKDSFTAKVERGSATSSIGANTTVLLAVILAIIFVVLVVVLIVLLTRKPEKTREFGESYY